MKILLTGFEPFGEHTINPSQILVQALPDQIEDIILLKGILPVHHDLALIKLRELVREHQPNAVIAFGLAAGRAKISLERVAVNLMDYSIADNAGVSIANQPISAHGPAAYFSTLPLPTLLAMLTEAGIPAEMSLSAGAYLCNQVFYTLMCEITSAKTPVPAGFIHLPALPQQAAASDKSFPSMNLEMMVAAARLMITILAQPPAEDLPD